MLGVNIGLTGAGLQVAGVLLRAFHRFLGVGHRLPGPGFLQFPVQQVFQGAFGPFGAVQRLGGPQGGVFGQLLPRKLGVGQF